MKTNKMVSASILSADFSKMGEEAQRMEKAGTDWLHCDVMDGSFVTNITFGFKMLSDLKKWCKLPFDVHLMIVKPERYLERFIEAGADLLSFHIEAVSDPRPYLNLIRSKGVKSGLAISPDTPMEKIFDYLDMCDFVIVMGVYPGYGAQGYIPATSGRIAQLRKEIDRRGLSTLIEIDGGVNLKTAPEIFESGADVLVSGSALFNAAEPDKFIKELKNC